MKFQNESPIYYASVSGGKDSAYMLDLLNKRNYPLDLVVNFDLGDMEWEVSHKVVNLIEEKCNALGIRFIRFKPRKSWKELYDKYGFPTAHARWCNGEYKLDCKKQLESYLKHQGHRPVAYIGLCADETKRFKYKVGEETSCDVIYPLAEEGITEQDVRLWARKQPVFEGYYKSLNRMGCKFCPFLSSRELAYLLKNEPENFKYMFECIKDTEKRIYKEKGIVWKFRDVGADVIEERIRTKWSKTLQYEEASYDIFDILQETA